MLQHVKSRELGHIESFSNPRARAESLVLEYILYYSMFSLLLILLFFIQSCTAGCALHRFPLALTRAHCRTNVQQHNTFHYCFNTSIHDLHLRLLCAGNDGSFACFDTAREDDINTPIFSRGSFTHFNIYSSLPTHFKTGRRISTFFWHFSMRLVPNG